MKVLFLIRSLGTGGAERQLVELCRGLDPARIQATVAAFYDGGARWDDLAALEGVKLISLGKRSRWDVVGFILRSSHTVKTVDPDVIYSFAQEPNLIAWLLGRIHHKRVFWGVRRSTATLPTDSFSRRLFFLCAKLSWQVELTVYNSFRGRELHLERGYCSSSAVVTNGFDTERFHPDEVARRRQRAEWGVGSEPLVGIVGRIQPLKGQNLFLDAAVLVSEEFSDARFVCVGKSVDDYLEEIGASESAKALGSRLIWAGECRDMPAVYNALDVYALCSTEEGCPNVVGEAMSCGVPCVVTDAGDAAKLVGETGIVVRERRAESVAEAIVRLLRESACERKERGAKARERIRTEFSRDAMVREVTALLEGRR